MKYFAQTLFNGTSISTANTSATSEQFDISEASRMWLQCSATGTSSTTDLSIQLQVSNDPFSTLTGDSIWINEGSASTFNTSNFFKKHTDLGALKARVVVTRSSGAAVLTIKSVSKPD